MHCQQKGKRMERRASPTQVRRAGREECMTTFCSSSVRESSARQLSGSREERRDQWVDTLEGGRDMLYWRATVARPGWADHEINKKRGSELGGRIFVPQR